MAEVIASSIQAVVREIAISDIVVDAALQMRDGLNEETVNRYRRAMQPDAESPATAADFPPLDLVSDGTTCWLVNGNHRLEAARLVGLTTFLCSVTPGDFRVARFAAFAANKHNSLQRSDADVGRAVRELLKDEEWAALSDRAIARHVGCSHTYVGNLRRATYPVATVATPAGPSGTTGLLDRIGVGAPPERQGRLPVTEELAARATTPALKAGPDASAPRDSAPASERDPQSAAPQATADAAAASGSDLSAGEVGARELLVRFIRRGGPFPVLPDPTKALTPEQFETAKCWALAFSDLLEQTVGPAATLITATAHFTRLDPGPDEAREQRGAA